MRLRIPLIAAILALPIFGCATLTQIERPEIRAVHPRITGIDFQGVNMAFDVDVFNPYPVPVLTPNFRYGVDIEGTRFFNSEATSRVDLPASAVGMVTLPVRFSYVDLLKTYQKLAGAPEAEYRLYGDLLLPVLGQSLQLPFSHAGKFPILRPPTFSDIDIQLASASFTGARVNIDAQMRNPNIFPLGIENLGYVLEFGNMRVGGLTARTARTLQAGKTGSLSLTGEVSAVNALLDFIRGGSPGEARILASGLIQTPYGPVRLR